MINYFWSTSIVLVKAVTSFISITSEMVVTLFDLLIIGGYTVNIFFSSYTVPVSIRIIKVFEKIVLIYYLHVSMYFALI